MSTKAQAVKALKRLHAGAQLEHDVVGDYWDTQLEAPECCHWDCADIHSRPVPMLAGSVPKSEYWDEVIDEIKLLGNAEPCTSETCCEWDTGLIRNVCGYWDKEQNT